MGMHRQPAPVSPFQYRGYAARPRVGASLLVETGRCPHRHAPRERIAATRMNAVHVDFVVTNGGPQALPLISAKGFETGLDLQRPGTEADHVRREDVLGRVVVESRAITVDGPKPFLNGL